jgi:DHA2 family multidrug resistance protein-like MFS transporter
VTVLAMIGVLFTMPQYFQGVLGTDAMGSGLRLLPLIAGLVVAAVPADRIAARWGIKPVVAAGFGLLAAGLALGSQTTLRSSGGFIAAWMALAGAGLGPGDGDDDVGRAEHAGAGAQRARVGGPAGAQQDGSSARRGGARQRAEHGLPRARLDGGLPAAAAHPVRASIFGAVTVARRPGSPALLHSAREAFVHGTDLGLLVSATVALGGAVLALAVLPQLSRRSTEPAGNVKPPHDEHQFGVAT